jgi:hypothetical protein
MRKLKQLTLALLLVTIAFAGCKKDETQNSVKQPDAQLSKKTTMQLLAFREQLKLKSGNSLPVDSANWYLEGLLNYEQANNNHQFDGLQFFYDTLVMYTSGAELTMNDLNAAHTYFSNKLAEITQAQNITDFAFDAVDISVVTSGLKNGETQLTMIVGGGSNTVGYYTAFGSTDYWTWGMQGGKCGAYAGQGGISDAAQELNYKFNHPLAVPGPGYYTEVIPAYADGTEFPDLANPGPYCDYKIFWFNAGNTGIWPCLAPDELNYYLSTMPYIINAKRPVGKSYVNVNVIAFFPPNYTNVYSHLYILNYGYFHPNEPNN